MVHKTNKRFIDFRQNFQKKTELIEDLKNLILSNSKPEEKESIFKNIRKKWLKIGKVPNHLAFNLNNSYKHQIKLYYDLVYLNNDFKQRDLEKNLIEKRELIIRIKKLNDLGNKIKAYKDSLKIIKRWNFLTGPTRQNHDLKLNEEFDQYIKKIKDSKKDYLNNKDRYVKLSIENKKSLIDEMKLIYDKGCIGKNEWLKKINSFENSKEKFMRIGPIDDNENEELWKKYKKLNKVFLKEKNLFFKNLKKEYSNNINKQIELINDLKNFHDKDELPKQSVLKELKEKFNSVENVPYKKNKENRNVFFNLLNDCYERIGNNISEKRKNEKKNLEKLNVIIKEIKENFSKQNIHDEIQKLSDIDVSIPIKQLNELSDFLSKKFKDGGHNQSDIDTNILKIKSSLMSDKEKTLAKIKIKKRIDDIKKQIGQLENNLTFIKSDKVDNSIFKNVHSQIEKFNQDLILQEKKLSHFI